MSPSVHDRPIVIFASGSGSNFEAIVRASDDDARFVLVCDKKDAYVLKRAEMLGVPAHSLYKEDFATREQFDEALARLAAVTLSARLVVLAGFMHRLSPRYFETIEANAPGLSTINLHPAHREDYKGARAYDFALARLYPRWGLSVHVVTPELDSGPLIDSCEIEVYPWESKERFVERAQKVEHKLISNAVKRTLKESAC